MAVIEKFRPLETVRAAAYAVRLLGAEALAAIDRKLDWQPDDTLEEARIKSDIWERMSATKVEAPVPREEDLL